MNTQLFVGNIAYSATDEDLEELFLTHGFVAQVSIKNDRETGKPRGFGFVTLQSPEDVSAAIEKLNGLEFQERKLTVNEARPRAERSDRPNRFGGGGGGGGRDGGYRDHGGGGGRRDRDRGRSRDRDY